MIGVGVPRNLNVEGGIAPITTAASPTAPTATSGVDFDGVSDMDQFPMPQYISDQDNKELYVTQLRKKLPQGFIQFMDQYAIKSLDQMVEKTINLNYYNTGYDEK